ncbi:MAG: 4-hydroxy-tetrahydrodipicolinate synthase [Phycisphaerae bacterium]|nr:MAG: 4-hydroxy-tetrahydrodipicolinate synthase [Phycisphaerae bacterium]
MFSGPMTALITPFANGTVDETRFKQQIERQIRGGISAIVAVGTTGESPTLTVEEHERVIELAVKFADGRIKVIAGTGANSTAEALELHRFAKQVGADACLSVDPYYNKPTQEGLYRHFMTLSDGVDLPIILYTIPGRTGITMSPSTAARLYKNGNFAAMKWATGQLDYASELMSLCDMPVLSGDDSQTLPLLSIGGVGVISVLSNLLPEKVSQLYGRFKQGDLVSAAQIHHEVFSLTRTLFLDGNPAGIKYAMKIVGLDTGEMRLPLVEVSDPTKKALETEVRKFF